MSLKTKINFKEFYIMYRVYLFFNTQIYFKYWLYVLFKRFIYKNTIYNIVFRMNTSLQSYRINGKQNRSDKTHLLPY